MAEHEKIEEFKDGTLIAPPAANKIASREFSPKYMSPLSSLVSLSLKMERKYLSLWTCSTYFSLAHSDS